MTAFEIPTSSASQTFSITLGGVAYQLTLIWCDPAQAWTLDIADANGNDILTGLQLVTGADLLEQFGYMNFGGSLIAQTDNNPDLPPTFDDLGSTGHLYFVTNP